MTAPAPGTVSENVDHTTPLPAVGTFEHTPAYAAIRDGIARYLEENGYRAEHPLLYVDERDDPFVYVRLYVSDDGLGFRDRAYVYSPSVAQHLHALYEAYDIFTATDPNVFHASDTEFFGRPVHAHIEALDTMRIDEYIESFESYDAAPRRAREARPPKSAWRRRRIRLKACLRRGRPAFSRPPEPYDDYWQCGPRFAALPLNWPPCREDDDFGWFFSCWRADPDPAATAAASLAVWREYVEPRFIHASLERGKGVELRTWLHTGFHGNESGDGVMGADWHMHDRLYWVFKMPLLIKYFWNGIRMDQDCRDGYTWPMAEFEDLTWNLERAVRAWPGRPGPEWSTLDAKSQDAVVERALQDPNVAAVAWLFRRKAVIYAHRYDVPPGSDWREQLQGHGNDADKSAEQAIHDWLCLADQASRRQASKNADLDD